LKNPADDFWNNHPDQAKSIGQFKLFNVKQVRPLCMIAHEKLDAINFTKLLEILVVISFRYNIISGMNPNEQEKTYNQIAVKLYGGEVNTLTGIKTILKNIYINDEQFKSNFAVKSINTRSRKRLVKYILAELEEDASQIAIDFNSSRVTIEHVLPENPGDDWNHLSFDDQKEAVYLLGNMVLLENNINRDVGNAGFKTKKAQYCNSKYQLPKDIDADVWDLQAIKKRQQNMALRAAHVWRINF
jgi:hypothetical protein